MNNDITMAEHQLDEGKLFFLDSSQEAKETYISDILPLKFDFKTWIRDSHGLFDFEGAPSQIQK